MLAALLLGLGPVRGIFANVAIYLPLTVMMARTKFTGHLRGGLAPKTRVGVLGAAKVFREVSRDRVLVSMIVLAGLGSFFSRLPRPSCSCSRRARSAARWSASTGVGANGMRIGSGFTVGLFGAVVGLFGAVVGLRWSLGLSATAMCLCTAVVGAYIAAGTRRAVKAA